MTSETNQSIKGIVLSTRDYADNDYLVKVFTEEYGIVSFLARGAKKNKSKLYNQLFVSSQIEIIGKLPKNEGLGFINDATSKINSNIQLDIIKTAWVTYMGDLIDYALDEHQVNQYFYSQLEYAINKIEVGLDPQIITNIVQLQLLEPFGVQTDWHYDAIDHQTDSGDFDYSEKFSGIIAKNHWHLDEHRLHADQKVIYYLRQFSQINIKNINTIDVNDRTKRGIQLVLDNIYEKQVGVNPKSKNFINQLNKLEGQLDDSSKTIDNIIND